MIINITGQAGAGKTTLAKELLDLIPKSINVDGDELREVLINKDYSEQGRRNNITNAYNIAKFLEFKGFTPIISLISPYRDLRENLKASNDVLEIYVFTSEIRGRENFFAPNYEKPIEKYIPVDTTNESAEKIAETINLCLNKGFYKHLFINTKS
jgi:adenylylsulfate kinase